MKVLITGAGGMLADAVGIYLASRGDQALAFHRTPEEAAKFRLKFPQFQTSEFEFGLSEPSKSILERLYFKVQQFEPDWIFHLAAWTDVDGCETNPNQAERSNAIGSLEVALAAEGTHTRLLAVSTDYVFGGDSDKPYLEHDFVNPLSVYGRSKAKGERFIQVEGGAHLIARTAWLFGPFGGNFVDTIRSRLSRNEPVRVVNDQRGCPTLTTDLALALRTLAERDARGIVNVVNSGDATWFELAVEIARHMGREHLVSAISTAELNRPAPRPRYSVLDSSRYAAIAGAPLPDWRDALRRYLALPTN